MNTNSNSFISKLEQMATVLILELKNPHNFEFIRFNEVNSELEIADKKKLELLLPKYFRHEKFESFARQLNWYGFYKKGNKVNDSYGHPDLEKGLKYKEIYQVSHKENLEEIQSKTKKIVFLLSRVISQLKKQERLVNKNKLFRTVKSYSFLSSVCFCLSKLIFSHRLVEGLDVFLCDNIDM